MRQRPSQSTRSSSLAAQSHQDAQDVVPFGVALLRAIAGSSTPFASRGRLVERGSFRARHLHALRQPYRHLFLFKRLDLPVANRLPGFLVLYLEFAGCRRYTARPCVYPPRRPLRMRRWTPLQNRRWRLALRDNGTAQLGLL